MSDFTGKRVLVTGATGLIGSCLVRKLLKENAIVIAMGRNEIKLQTVFSGESDSKHLQFATGNIVNGISKDIVNLDYIFHAASPISGMEIKEKPVDTISANLSGTLECLEYLKEQGKGRLVVFSSATVYGNQLDEEMVVDEDQTDRADVLHAVNAPYSESKRMIEVVARAYTKQYNVDTVIVRIGYVYGYINPCPQTAFYEFINNASSGKNIVLNNAGMGRRDNIHVKDVVDGLILVAAKGKTSEVYNISSNGDKDNYKAIDEMAHMIADAANSIYGEQKVNAIVKAIDGERKAGMRLNNTKLKSLGWDIKINIEDGIFDTVEQFIHGGNN